MLKHNQLQKEKMYNFIVEDWYEDEYSHDEINKFQHRFKKEVIKYLDKNYNGKYDLYIDWCVHIVLH